MPNFTCDVGKHRVRRWIFLPAALEKMAFSNDCFIILQLKSLSFGSDKMQANPLFRHTEYHIGFLLQTHKIAL